VSGYIFDGNGNPTTYSGKNLTFDIEDRLVAITSPAFSAAYAPDDRRASKTASGATTYYLYDEDGGASPLLEEQGTGTVSMGYGMAGDGLRARYAPASGGLYYLFQWDPQGSLVQRQTGGSGGGANNSYYALDTAMFDGYGAKLGDTDAFTGGAEATRDAMGFQGQFGAYTDNETGLVLMGHRYYDAGTGRFLTRDPMGYGGGINLYGFTGNNPVNESDADGTSMDPKKGAGPDWVRVSTTLFIPMPEFHVYDPINGWVTNKGDGRSYDYNTDADRVRVDFALNTVTGQLINYPPHTAGSILTYYNNFALHANADMSAPVTVKKSGAGWVVSVHAQGADPFYELGPLLGETLEAPNASVTARFNITGSNVTGSVHYRDFPSLEIYAYNSAYPGGHKFLFGYQPSPTIQHSTGVLNLAFGEHEHSKF